MISQRGSISYYAFQRFKLSEILKLKIQSKNVLQRYDLFFLELIILLTYARFAIKTNSLISVQFGNNIYSCASVGSLTVEEIV